MINAGRAFQLSRVLQAINEPNPDAGQVLASLMHVADVLSIARPSASTLCCTSAQAPLTVLAIEYLHSILGGQAQLKVPDISVVESVSLRLKADDGVADPEAELFLLDGQPDVQRKLKRAFCEPGNVEFCPPIALAEELIMQYTPAATLVVSRKPENGGDLSFSTSADLRRAFATGELHPGDLKPSVRDGVDAIIDRVRKALADDKSLKEAEKELAKVLKRKKK